MSEITPILGIIIGFAGLFGWTRQALSLRLEKLEAQMAQFPSRSELRVLVDDKLAPQKVENATLARRLDELQDQAAALDEKVDRLLEICVKLSHEK